MRGRAALQPRIARALISVDVAIRRALGNVEKFVNRNYKETDGSIDNRNGKASPMLLSC